MAITGLSTASSALGTRWMFSHSRLLCSSGVGRPSPMRPTSPPVQKARPAPVTTSTRTTGSRCASLSAHTQRSIIAWVKAFSLSGRLSVSMAIPSWTA
jgi:hypothetical protein